MKVKVLETHVPVVKENKKINFFNKVLNRSNEKNTKYLIERYYKSDDLIEYLICEDYNFKTNTFSKGVISFKLPLAYQVFNTFVNKNILLGIDDEVKENESVEGIDQ